MNFVKTLINIERLQKRIMPYALVSSASELRARLQRRRARSCVQRTCRVQGHVDVSLPTHPSFLHRYRHMPPPPPRIGMVAAQLHDGALLRLRLEGGGKCAEVDLVVEGRLEYLKP